MNAVHPTFALLLDSMCPKQEPVTPPCPRGSYEYVLATDLGDVVCWLDHSPAEAQTLEYPGCDEEMTLTHAWIKDLDIFERLEEDACKSIAEAALCQLVEERREHNTDHRINRRYG